MGGKQGRPQVDDEISDFPDGRTDLVEVGFTKISGPVNVWVRDDVKMGMM